jgi:hypothetical protein
MATFRDETLLARQRKRNLDLATKNTRSRSFPTLTSSETDNRKPQTFWEYLMNNKWIGFVFGILASSTAFAEGEYEDVYQAKVTMGEVVYGCPPGTKCLAEAYSVELKVFLKNCSDKLLSFDMYHVNDTGAGEVLIASAVAASPPNSENCGGEKVVTLWKMTPQKPKAVFTFDTKSPEVL